MTAYVVAHFTITDEEEYGRYAEAFFPIFSRHNGELVAVDDDRPIVEGTVPQGRTVILAFPDMDALTAWFNDPEYQKISEHRRAGTRPHVITFIDERPLAGPDPRPRRAECPVESGDRDSSDAPKARTWLPGIRGVVPEPERSGTPG